MYVKTTSRTNKDGTPVRYLHLAHNQWDPAAGRSVPKVLYSFGREDALDRAAIRRLVASLSKLLDPAGALAATAGSDLVFVESRPFGGAFVLDALWRRLGIDKAITGLDHGPRPGRPRNAAATERVLFGLVANRALAPSSKLAAAEWITHDVHIENLPEIGEQACYRAMDWLHGAREHLEARIFGKVATVLNLEVDLLFFDTTSTYFELEQADEEVARNWRGEKAAGEDDEDPDKAAGFRTHGNSKDSRDDLPQIVIGMAVTRDGIPVRCWCWPGNASDQVVIRQVKGRNAGLDLVQDRVGDRPRVLLRREPPLPALGGSPLHHRGETALRVGPGPGRAVPPGPLHRHRREHAHQGGPDQRP